jgi:hypothetical protein
MVKDAYTEVMKYHDRGGKKKSVKEETKERKHMYPIHKNAMT